jgi:hypothetical protein
LKLGKPGLRAGFPVGVEVGSFPASLSSGNPG